jgi:hypothetical protein
MKCREFAGVVHELARREQLDPAIAAIARAHAEACPHCGCHFAEAERLAGLVQAASAEGRRVAAPERLEENLLAAFRWEHASRRNVREHRHLGWRMAFGWAGVGAAVALLSFVLLHRAPDHRPSPMVRAGAEAPAVATVPTGQNVTVAVARTPVGSAPYEVEQAQYTSEFVPVPYAGGMAPGDSAVIVRVQIPRTALAELGYPIDETQSNAVVQADLLVGEDGWPHAVRIVR